MASTIDERLGMIGGDERKVKQVLLNRLSNALKFTAEGGQIDVGARLSGDMAEVSLADTGIGIAPEDQAAVFEEFRQVGTADKKAEGTGLELALSRKFIELHGGRIWVKSTVGVGSNVHLYPPVAAVRAPEKTYPMDSRDRLRLGGGRSSEEARSHVPTKLLRFIGALHPPAPVATAGSSGRGPWRS